MSGGGPEAGVGGEGQAGGEGRYVTRVREAMLAEPRALTVGATAQEAGAILARVEVRSVLVVDVQGLLVGEVTRASLVERVVAAGRDPSNVKLVCPVLTIVGDTDEEREHWRKRARSQIAFYGSTRTYAGVFETHGWHGVSENLHALQRAGDVAGMAAAVTDDMLDVLAITATWDDLAAKLLERYAGAADRIVMYFSGSGWREDASTFGRWAEVARAVRGGNG